MPIIRTDHLRDHDWRLPQAPPATFPAAVPDGVTLNTAVVAAPPARGTGELTSPLAPTLVSAVVAASSDTKTDEVTPPPAPTLGTDAALATVVAAPPRRVCRQHLAHEHGCKAKRSACEK